MFWRDNVWNWIMISIGCDIEEIARISKINVNHRLAYRILGEFELELYKRFNSSRQTEFLAGRFCAKESIVKALKQTITMKHIDLILNNGEFTTQINNYTVQVSISHTKQHAMAMVIAYETT